MKHNKYVVTFTTGKIEIVYTNGFESAKILAQAEQIKAGNMYDVESIVEYTKENIK